jgi:hypothetical protein
MHLGRFVGKKAAYIQADSETGRLNAFKQVIRQDGCIHPGRF